MSNTINPSNPSQTRRTEEAKPPPPPPKPAPAATNDGEAAPTSDPVAPRQAPTQDVVAGTRARVAAGDSLRRDQLAAQQQGATTASAGPRRGIAPSSEASSEAATYQALGKATLEHDSAATERLANEAEKGNDHAIQAARDNAVDKHGMHNANASRILAKAPPEKLTQKDVDTILKGATGLHSEPWSYERQFMDKQLQAGDEKALTAVRSVLDEKSDYTNSAEQKKAAEMLGKNPKHMTADDVKRLEKHATQQGDQFLRDSATEALDSAAKAKPPIAGAREAHQRAVDAVALKRGELNELGKKAKAGDQEAIRKLSSIISDPKATEGVESTRQGDVKRQATDALIAAKAHLQKDAYDALGKATLDHNTSATEFLASEAAKGNDLAIGAARANATDAQGGVNTSASRILAKAPKEKLTQADVNTIARGAAEGAPSSYERQFMDKALAAGDEKALKAVRGLLAETPHYTNSAEQQRAMEMLEKNPQHMTADDVKRLTELATTGDDERRRGAAAKALGSAAAKAPPVEGASAAFAKALEQVPLQKDQPGRAYSRDDVDSIRDAAREYAGPAFQNATDPQAKAALADDALVHARDSQTGVAAAEALAGRAKAGDERALAALSYGTGNSFPGSATQDRAATVLKEVADSGKRESVTQALQKEWERSGKSDDGKTLETLGAVASKLPRGTGGAPSALEQSARKTLVEGLANTPLRGRGDFKGSESAARGLAHFSDRLSSTEIDALGKNLTPASADTLGQAAAHMQPADRNKVKEMFRDNLEKSRSVSESVAGMKAMAPFLEAKDVDAVARHAQVLNGMDKGAATDALAGILKQGNAAAQGRAAEGLLKLSHGEMTQEASRALTDHALASNDAGLKQRVLDKLPRSPITGTHLENIAKDYGRRVSSAIKNAPEGSDLQKLGKLLTAKQLASNPDYKANVDVAKVDKQINDLANGPLKGTLERIRQDAVRANTSPELGQKQEEFMKSEAFQDRLKLMGKDDATREVRTELAKLAGIAPERVQTVADHLAGRAVQENGLKAFQSMKDDPAAQERGLQEALNKLTGTTGKSASVVKRIGSVLNVIDKETDAAKVADKLTDALSGMADAARRAGNAAELNALEQSIDVVKKLNARGQLGTFITGAALIGLAAKGTPQNGEEWAAAASTVMGAVSNASDVGKLFRVAEMSKLGKALKFLDVLGPAGDFVGAGVDAYGSVREFQNGDYVGGTAKAVGAASGIAGGIAGIAILAGATGPAAPAVLLGAAVVGLAAWGVDAIWGKSEEQSFLENLGVWKD